MKSVCKGRADRVHCKEKHIASNTERSGEQEHKDKHLNGRQAMDGHRHWSDRDPSGSPGFLLPPQPQAMWRWMGCGGGRCVSTIPLHTAVLALCRHRECRWISRAVCELANPQGHGALVGKARLPWAHWRWAGWVLTSVARLLQTASSERWHQSVQHTESEKSTWFFHNMRDNFRREGKTENWAF